eukprot:4267176-Prymnesium_polylepis.1
MGGPPIRVPHIRPLDPLPRVSLVPPSARSSSVLFSSLFSARRANDVARARRSRDPKMLPLPPEAARVAGGRVALARMRSGGARASKLT